MAERRAKKRQVSDAMLVALRKTVEGIIKTNPTLEERWLRECCTSAETRVVGIVSLNTEYDWMLGFMIWREGQKDLLPRDPN